MSFLTPNFPCCLLHYYWKADVYYKLYFFNIKRDIPEEYITALMNKMCYMLDFCLFDGETIEPKTYKFISKQIRSFNMSF